MSPNDEAIALILQWKDIYRDLLREIECDGQPEEVLLRVFTQLVTNPFLGTF